MKEGTVPERTSKGALDESQMDSFGVSLDAGRMCIGKTRCAPRRGRKEAKGGYFGLQEYMTADVYRCG
jgi:hypothetical protein